MDSLAPIALLSYFGSTQILPSLLCGALALGSIEASRLGVARQEEAVWEEVGELVPEAAWDAPRETARESPLEAPPPQASPARGPLGYWLIEAEGELFSEPLTIQVTDQQGELAGRVLARGGRRLLKAPLLFWGLRKKGDEYLYGQIQLLGKGKELRYRCKLWLDRSHLFLRIYNPPTYSTHRLSALESNPNPNP